jgi:sugar lactone lactonase YvrE
VPFRFTLLAVLVLAQFLGLAGRASGEVGWGIVVDSQGAVAFTDIVEGAVWRMPPGGEPAKIALDKSSRALVLGEGGRLYGAEPAPLAALWAVDRDGTLSYIIPPGVNLPMDLRTFTLDSRGTLYSVTTGTGTVLLQRRTPAGRIETVAGGGRGHADGNGNAARFQGIDGMAWGRDGLLYLADGPYARTVSPEGAVKTLGGRPVTDREEGDLLGLAVAPDGTVYAADYGRRRVLRISPGGEARTVLTAERLWSPTGVAVAGSDLYILEQLRGSLAFLGDLGVGPYLQVRRVPAQGAPVVLARFWGGNTVVGAGVLAAILLLLFLLLRRRRRSRYGSRRIRL